MAKKKKKFASKVKKNVYKHQTLLSGWAGVNQEDCVFIWYLKDGTKALMLAFTHKETSEAQFLIGRLKI